jgi:trk system potassium uptake protein TrkA
MRTLIVGAGVVGTNLAEELSSAGHVVSLVDRSQKIVDQLNERMDILAVQGHGCNPDVLRKAGIEDAQLVLAVTNIDEVNVVICMLARHFGVQHKIARLRHARYAGPDGPLDPADLGIDTIIQPEEIIITEVMNILKIPGSTEVASFAEGQVLLVTFDVEADAPVAGKRLRDLREAAAMASFLVVAIFRNETSLVPRGDDIIEAGDHIAVMVHADMLPIMLPMIQPRVRRVERIVIYGGNMLGRSLAARLEREFDHVAMIVPDAEQAERAATRLRDTLVLHGSATDPAVLREALHDNCDYFMAVSKDDELNMLSALMARRHHARRVIVLAQNPDYLPLLKSVGMDVVINPRLATAGEIIKFIRQGQIHVVTRLKESEAEAIELEAVKQAPITRKPLKEQNLPSGSIIGAVMRDGEMMIPDGNCWIRAGETVIVFALPEAIPRIERLFDKRRRFSR